MKYSKLYKKQLELVAQDKKYTLEKAIKCIKAMPITKFDQTLELSMKLGIDTKQSDQNVRGVVSLPHGTGKNISVVAIGSEEQLKGVKAEFTGGDELIEKIKKGWTNFDILISTPDFMPKLRILGKILGPKGLMPNLKTGTVSKDLISAVQMAKTGRVEYRTDKTGGMNAPIGKLSFSEKSLKENLTTLVNAINKARPNKCKGTYILSTHLSATMTPSIQIDLREVTEA